MDQKKAAPPPLQKLNSLTELEDMIETEGFKPDSQPILNELRQKIKDAMIPLLIQIFHLRRAKQEDPPSSRLQNNASQQDDNVVSKLSTLQKDLTQLSLWCTSCLNQIEKALSPEEEKLPKQCAASKKISNLKFSQLFSFESPSQNTPNLREKLKLGEKEHPPSPKKTSLLKAISLAFRRNQNL